MKQTFTNQQGLIQLDGSSVIFADSIVTSGMASAVAIAVGDYSSAAKTAEYDDASFDIDN